MLALTRNVGDREQRIFVLGDVDCISNAELLMSRVGMKTSNFSLITGMFRWLSYGEFPIVLSNIPPVDTVLELRVTTRYRMRNLLSRGDYPSCSRWGILACGLKEDGDNVIVNE